MNYDHINAIFGRTLHEQTLIDVAQCHARKREIQLQDINTQTVYVLLSSHYFIYYLRYKSLTLIPIVFGINGTMSCFFVSLIKTRQSTVQIGNDTRVTPDNCGNSISQTVST